MNENTKEKKPRLWYLRCDGKVRGPFPSGAIRRFLLLERVLLRDELSPDGKHWKPVASEPEVVPREFRKSPESMKAALAVARRREDERTGTDRRAPAQGVPPVGRRQGERRAEESEETAKHRESRRELTEALSKQSVPVLSIIAVSVLTLSVIGIGLYFGKGRTFSDPTCNAPPAPGVDWRQCYLEGIRAASKDLSKANLNSALLRGADFSGSRFDGGDLRYADLSGANLSYARLAGVAMKGSNLQMADLAYADLAGADLSFANLRGAKPGGADFKGARLDNAIWFDGTQCAPGSVGKCIDKDKTGTD